MSGCSTFSAIKVDQWIEMASSPPFIIKFFADFSPKDFSSHSGTLLLSTDSLVVARRWFSDFIIPSAVIIWSSSIKKDFSLVNLEIQFAQE